MDRLRRSQAWKLAFIAFFCLIIFAKNIFAVEHEANYDFQVVEIGSSSKAALSITNPGDMSVNLKITLSGDPGFEAFTDLTNLITVTPQETITIEIRFTPSAMGEKSAEIIITDGTPFYLSRIKLTGEGIEKNSQINIADIIEFYDSAVFNGTIRGIDNQIQLSDSLSMKKNGKGLSKKVVDLDENRLNAFRNMLVSAQNEIDDSNEKLACEQLAEIQFKTDGQNPPVSPPDFIFGEDKTDLVNMISILMQQLKCY